MKTAATPKQTVPETTPALCMPIESGATEWKLYFSTGLGQHPRERTVPAQLQRLLEEVARAKKHFGLSADASTQRSVQKNRACRPPLTPLTPCEAFFCS